MPIYALFFVIAVLSSVGLPGLNGFVGEYLVLLGTFERSPILAAIAVTGVIFGAVYLLMATRKMLFGPLVNSKNKTLSDIGGREIALMLPIVALIVWMGVAPNVFLSRTNGSLDALSQRLDRARAVRTAQLETHGEDPARIQSFGYAGTEGKSR
jgi:NADH-quinone oxidoreductase subunit M